MFIPDSFGSWIDDDHRNSDQLKRILSATQIKESCIKMSEDRENCYIVGSSGNDYFVTLDSCECIDFERRGKPCKHIYRFAIEKGIITIPKRNKKLSESFNSEEEIKRYDNLLQNGIISFEKYVKIVEAIEKGH